MNKTSYIIITAIITIILGVNACQIAQTKKVIQ